MKNFRNIFLVLLFSLSFGLTTNAQDGRVGGISNFGTPTNTLPQNEGTLPTGFGLTDITANAATEAGNTNDLPIDSNLVLLLVAGILFAFYKFQVYKKSKANS